MGAPSPYGSGALDNRSQPNTAYAPSAADMASLTQSLGNYTYPGQGVQSPRDLFSMGSGYNVNNTGAGQGPQQNLPGGNFFGTVGLGIGGPNALPNGGGWGVF